MKYHASITALLFLFILCSVGCQHHYTNHDLEGTWESDGYTINSRGKTLTTKTLKIEVDSNGLITGTSAWRAGEGPGGHDGESPTRSATEEVLGAFDPDTGTFYLVETEENGFSHGQMLPNGTIRVFKVQAGTKPVASATTLTRIDR